MPSSPEGMVVCGRFVLNSSLYPSILESRLVKLESGVSPLCIGMVPGGYSHVHQDLTASNPW